MAVHRTVASQRAWPVFMTMSLLPRRAVTRSLFTTRPVMMSVGGVDSTMGPIRKYPALAGLFLLYSEKRIDKLLPHCFPHALLGMERSGLHLIAVVDDDGGISVCGHLRHHLGSTRGALAVSRAKLYIQVSGLAQRSDNRCVRLGLSRNNVATRAGRSSGSCRSFAGNAVARSLLF